MKLSKRHSNHRYDKYRDRRCSSFKLHLEHSIIFPLEECEEDLSKEREQYWIDKIDCVNERRAIVINKKEYKNEKSKEYYRKNKEKILKKNKEYYENNKEKNKDKINAREREYYQKNKEKRNARKRELRKLKKNNLN